jgi:hypothetical protein
VTVAVNEQDAHEFRHVAVLLDGFVVDWTWRQLVPDGPLPLVERLEQYLDRFCDAALEELEYTRGADGKSCYHYAGYRPLRVDGVNAPPVIDSEAIVADEVLNACSQHKYELKAYRRSAGGEISL